MQWESIERMVIGSIYHRLAKKRGWVHRLIHDERRVKATVEIDHAIPHSRRKGLLSQRFFFDDRIEWH